VKILRCSSPHGWWNVSAAPNAVQKSEQLEPTEYRRTRNLHWDRHKYQSPDNTPIRRASLHCARFARADVFVAIEARTAIGCVIAGEPSVGQQNPPRRPVRIHTKGRAVAHARSHGQSLDTPQLDPEGHVTWCSPDTMGMSRRSGRRSSLRRRRCSTCCTRLATRRTFVAQHVEWPDPQQ